VEQLREAERAHVAARDAAQAEASAEQRALTQLRDVLARFKVRPI